MYNWHFPSYGAIYLYVGRERERERDRGYVNYSLIVLFIDCLVFSLCGMALTLDLSFTFLEGMMD